MSQAAPRYELQPLTASLRAENRLARTALWLYKHYANGSLAGYLDSALSIAYNHRSYGHLLSGTLSFAGSPLRLRTTDLLGASPYPPPAELLTNASTECGFA